MLLPAHERRADDEPPFMLFVRRVNLRFRVEADNEWIQRDVR